MARLQMSARPLPREFYIDPHAFVEAELAAGRKKETPAQKKAISKAIEETRRTGVKKDGKPSKYTKKKTASSKTTKKPAAKKKALGAGLEQITKPKVATKKPAKTSAVERIADAPAGWEGIQRKVTVEPSGSLAEVIHQIDGWVAHHSGGPAAVVTKGKRVHIFHGDDADKQAIAFVDAQGEKARVKTEKEAARTKNTAVDDLARRLHTLMTAKLSGTYSYDRDAKGALLPRQEDRNAKLDAEYRSRVAMFHSLLARIRADKSITREDAIDLAYEFDKYNYDGTKDGTARRMPKRTSRDTALNMIERRMNVLETSHAKSRAQGGRSAA